VLYPCRLLTLDDFLRLAFHAWSNSGIRLELGQLLLVLGDPLLVGLDRLLLFLRQISLRVFIIRRRTTG